MRAQRCAAAAANAVGVRIDRRFCARRHQLTYMRYDERALKPVNNAIKDYQRILGIKVWTMGEAEPEYWEETGICLRDADEDRVAV